MPNILPCRALAAFAFLLALAAGPAHAGVLEVRPTTLIISPSQHIAVLSLVNPEMREFTYQIRIYTWKQEGEEQRLEPAADIIASPPMVTLLAHGTQIVRVGIRAGTLPQDEATYRLILEEIPTLSPNEQQSLNIALRVSLPLFIRPFDTLPPAQLGADMSVSGDDAIITVRNKGHFTSRIVSATLKTDMPGSADKDVVTRLTYIMPGGAADFKFHASALPAISHGTTVSLQTDSGLIDVDAPLAAGVVTNVSQPSAP